MYLEKGKDLFFCPLVTSDIPPAGGGPVIFPCGKKVTFVNFFERGKMTGLWGVRGDKFHPAGESRGGNPLWPTGQLC
jgi:hypothetical protein